MIYTDTNYTKITNYNDPENNREYSIDSTTELLEHLIIDLKSHDEKLSTDATYVLQEMMAGRIALPEPRQIALLWA